MRMLPELLGSLSQLLPPWAMAILLGALLAVAVPAWLFFVRSKQIRGHLRKAIAKGPAERDEHIEAAFSLARDRPRCLVALADEAVRLNQKPVWQRALRDLDDHPRWRRDVRRIRGQVSAKKERGRHPLEEAVIIERLLEQQMWTGARERLAEARRRFPDNPDLAALSERLADEDADGA